jgi:hypothetical protein
VKRALIVSIVVIISASSSVMAQLAVAPEGAVLPNGAFHYVVPDNIPLAADPLPYDLRFPVAPIYGMSYPMVPIPVPPFGRSTSDRIKPQNYNEPALEPMTPMEGKLSLGGNAYPATRAATGQQGQSAISPPRTSQ